MPACTALVVADATGTIVGSTDPALQGRAIADEEVFKVGRDAATTSIFFKNTDGAVRQYWQRPFISKTNSSA